MWPFTNKTDANQPETTGQLVIKMDNGDQLSIPNVRRGSFADRVFGTESPWSSVVDSDGNHTRMNRHRVLWTRWEPYRLDPKEVVNLALEIRRISDWYTFEGRTPKAEGRE